MSENDVFVCMCVKELFSQAREPFCQSVTRALQEESERQVVLNFNFNYNYWAGE